MRPCGVTVICIKYIGSRSAQVMISESRAALHLCTCGNRATTDNGGGDGDVATTAAATTAVAISLRWTTAAASMPTPPPPPSPPPQLLWQWRRLPPLSDQSTICHDGAPPLHQGSAATARHRRRRRRAYAVQYNVVTLRSGEHIEYRSCPALHWVLACLAFYQYSLWCVCVFVE